MDVKPSVPELTVSGGRLSGGSSFATGKHIIRLLPEDLDLGDQSLDDFIRFSQHVVTQIDPDMAARYGGILYLALLSAFETAGMTKLDWAPALTLEVQSVDYEVSCF